MKTLSVSRAVHLLREVRERFRENIVSKYEFRAKNCGNCENRGICCTDEHFVNVHVTRLEALAIKRAVDTFSGEDRRKVLRKAEVESARFDSKRETDTFHITYSCPLYDPKAGCLVHRTAKPLPCINHACYEQKADLPPDEILEGALREVTALNSRVFGNAWGIQPIPLWISEMFTETQS